MILVEQDGQKLLLLARNALEAHFGLANHSLVVDVTTPNGVGGVFVTLKLDGQLRGCIGYVSPELDLPKNVARAVVAAAVDDVRFQRLTAREVSRARISISVLTPAETVEDLDDIQIGRDGLVIERDGARGLLLPQVASERNWTRERFLDETCLKAGLPPESWQDALTRVLRFAATSFDEYSVNKSAAP